MTSSYTSLQYPNGKRIHYNENHEIVHNYDYYSRNYAYSKWVNGIVSKGELYRLFINA